MQCFPISLLLVMWIPLLSHRQSLWEDRISLVHSSIHLGPKGSGPGSLLSIYTSWNRSLISPWEVWYPTSWMVGTSTSRSSPRRPHWQQQWINLSASLHPDSAVCTNILWRMTRWFRPLISHHGYSFRNNSASMWHLASHMDSPSFLTGSPLSNQGFVPFVDVIQL